VKALALRLTFSLKLSRLACSGSASKINRCMSYTVLEIYHLLSRRGLTHSLRDFSAYYLGRAENYACIRGDRPPSEHVMIHLFRRLWWERRFILAAKIGWIILFGNWETNLVPYVE